MGCPHGISSAQALLHVVRAMFLGLEVRFLAGAAGAAFLFACIDSPRFDTPSNDGTMVRVPAAVLGGGTVATAGNGNGNGNGKDKDAGTPPTPPPTTPPTTPPATDPPPTDPTPSPPGPSGTVVNSFWLDAHEVTNAQYTGCVNTGACTASTCAAIDDHPVACVTPAQATAYCTYLSKRLPTEDEYTSASAGAANRLYPWGNIAPSTELVSMSTSTTSPVGSFPKGASPDGVFDLAGNVAELVATGRARGGSYTDTSETSLQSTAGITPTEATPSIGFRCARD